MQNKSDKIELVNVNSLIPHPKNMHDHSDEQVERLAKLIEYQGFRNPLIVQKGTNLIVAGHGRLMSAKKLGLKEVPVIYQEFESEAQLYAYIVSDNAIGKDTWAKLDLSKVNTEMLDLGPDFDIDMLGIKDFVIEPIEKYDPLTDEDDVPEVVNPITKRGDVWLLGNHRLMCGDSTVIDDVEKLMNGGKVDITFTSPPYNAGKNDHLVGVVNGFDNKYNNHNDAMGDEHYLDLIYQSTLNSIQFSRFSFINLQLLAHNKFVLVDYQYKLKEYLKDILIWNKKQCPPNIVKGAFNTKWEYVFCFSSENKTRGFPCDWRGKFPNVIETESNSGNEFAKNHKAGFPIAFPLWVIEKMDFAKSCYDPFMGTGTTFIVCEKLNLKGYGMELSEQYCDIIISRWQNITGNKAILSGTNDTYESIKESINGIVQSK